MKNTGHLVCAIPASEFEAYFNEYIRVIRLLQSVEILSTTGANHGNFRFINDSQKMVSDLCIKMVQSYLATAPRQAKKTDPADILSTICALIEVTIMTTKPIRCDADALAEEDELNARLAYFCALKFSSAQQNLPIYAEDDLEMKDFIKLHIEKLKQINPSESRTLQTKLPILTKSAQKEELNHQIPRQLAVWQEHLDLVETYRSPNHNFQ